MAIPIWLRANNPTGLRSVAQNKRKAFSFKTPGQNQEAEVVLGDDASPAKKAKLNINDSGVSCQDFKADTISAATLKIDEFTADNLTVNGNGSFGGNLNVIGNIGAVGNIGANGDIACDNLTCSGHIQGNGSATVVGVFECFSNAHVVSLEVDEIATLAGLHVTANALFNDTVDFTGSVSFADFLTANAEADFNDNAFFFSNLYYTNISGIGGPGAGFIDAYSVNAVVVEGTTSVFSPSGSFFNLTLYSFPAFTVVGGNPGGQTVTAGVPTFISAIQQVQLPTNIGCTYNAGGALTVPVTGLYRVQYAISFTYDGAAFTKNVQHGITVNNDLTFIWFSQQYSMSSIDDSTQRYLTGGGLMFLNAGDYVKITVAQKGTGSLVFCDNQANNEFSAFQLYSTP